VSEPNYRRDGASLHRFLHPLGFAVGKRSNWGRQEAVWSSLRRHWHNKCFPLLITMSTNVAAEYSRRSLSLAVLRRSRERVHNTKSIINDMLRWPELYAFEAPHLQAALEALEKAEVELNFLN